VATAAPEEDEPVKIAGSHPKYGKPPSDTYYEDEHYRGKYK
jgi:hypothetical protein